jgi:hypothetical protein
VRGGYLAEREAADRQFGRRGRGQGRADVRDRGVERLIGHPVQQHEAQRHVRRHAGAHRQHRVRPVRGVADHDGGRPRHRQVQRQVGAERHLDHPVRHRRERLDLFDRVFVPVIDDTVGAGLLGERAFSGPLIRRSGARSSRPAP